MGENAYIQGVENQILAALPQQEYERLLPKMEKVLLEFHQPLFEPDQRIEHVYFPYSGVASLLNVMENGERAEVGIVGYEGIVGLPVFLDADSVSSLAVVQIEGEGLKMKTEDFREEAGGKSAGSAAPSASALHASPADAGFAIGCLQPLSLGGRALLPLDSDVSRSGT